MPHCSQTVDPEQQAEQNEQLLAYAECMRREGIDFPDPDPVRRADHRLDARGRWRAAARPLLAGVPAAVAVRSAESDLDVAGGLLLP